MEPNLGSQIRRAFVMTRWCRIDREAARDRLAQLDMTQTALAERCGVELRTLQRWMAGGRTRLENAEAVARAMGVGTAEVFRGTSSERDDSPFVFMRSALRVLGGRESKFGNGLRAALTHFDFIDRYVSFTGHPRRGFVRRVSTGGARCHRFAVVRVTFPTGLPHRVVLGAQIGRALRYDFAEISFEPEWAELVELFHTRTARAPVEDGRCLTLWVWVSSEMRELVIMSDRDVVVEDQPEHVATIFDLRDEATRHAVCSRPSAMQLRASGLSASFDRVVGPRQARVDVAQQAAPPDR